MAWGYFVVYMKALDQHVNNIVYKQIKILLHARSRIPIFVQSFISI